MTRLSVIKDFLNANTSKPVQSVEFIEFWKACSEPERAEYARSAAQQLGVELDAVTA